MFVGADDADETSALPVRHWKLGMGELSRCALASWSPTGLLGAGDYDGDALRRTWIGFGADGAGRCGQVRAGAKPRSECPHHFVLSFGERWFLSFTRHLFCHFIGLFVMYYLLGLAVPMRRRRS